MANLKDNKMSSDAAMLALSGLGAPSNGSNPEVGLLQQELLQQILKRLKKEDDAEADQIKTMETIRQQTVESNKRAEAEKLAMQSMCTHLKMGDDGQSRGTALAGQRDHNGVTRLHCVRCLKEFNSEVVDGKKPKMWPEHLRPAGDRIGGPNTV